MRLSNVSLALLLFGLGAACATERSVERSAPAAAPPRFPAWLGLPDDLGRSPELEEVAALLCARDTDAVIDEDVRRAARVWDGQVTGLLHRGSATEARAALAREAAPLLEELSATHVGIAEGRLVDGRHCAALVAVRRRLALETDLQADVIEGEPFPLAATPRVGGPWRAAVYLLRPDGHVDKRELEGEGAFSEVVIPQAGEGRYVLEVVVTRADADDPEIALLWPFTVGTPKLPPAPRVLFPDEGHGDVALSYRMQALVERLRNTQLLDPLVISPELERHARRRVEALAAEGRLGHRLPGGHSAAEDLQASASGFAFSRLAEVQAQGGTLADAWAALLDSPAHRFELVRPGASHLGAAVTRGEDALGRPLVSVVLLVAKKIKVRPRGELSTELLGKLNLARHRLGRPPLEVRASLVEVATRQAEAMARARALDERALGAPVSEVALAADAGLGDVRAVVARLDDPLRLAPPAAALDDGLRAAGIGLARAPSSEWFLCLLTAHVDEEAP